MCSCSSVEAEDVQDRCEDHPASPQQQRSGKMLYNWAFLFGTANQVDFWVQFRLSRELVHNCLANFHLHTCPQALTLTRTAPRRVRQNIMTMHRFGSSTIRERLCCVRVRYTSTTHRINAEYWMLCRELTFPTSNEKQL